MVDQSDLEARRRAFGEGPERHAAEGWLAEDAPISSLGQEFLRYWRSKCPLVESGQTFPRRGDIHPEEIVHLLPYIFMLDVLRGDEELDFRFRLVGTAIVEIEGEHTGLRLSGMFPDRKAFGVLWQQYRDAAAGKVWVRHETLRWQDREHIAYEVILAPLENDSGEVTMLIGIAHAQNV